jgi:predicted acylesterase/phospholipase RssA
MLPHMMGQPDSAGDGQARGAAGRPPKGRFCDLVMKGGITSGVVYPKAIYNLSRHYYFRSIGGSSAGAIAAAAAAAAEYRRLTDAAEPDAGYERLNSLPEELQGESNGRTRLLSLFQPATSTRRPFAVLLSALNKRTATARTFAVVLGAVRTYWVPVAVAVLVFVVVYESFGRGFLAWLVGVVLLLLLGGLGVVGQLVLDLVGNVARNGFGLCKGTQAEGESLGAVSDWLHELFQDMAGPELRTPITFGDLWSAARKGLVEAEKGDATATERAIDLRLFVTNLNHGRPYLLPHDGKQERLFFKLADLDGYLPRDVLDWMKERCGRYRQSTPNDPPDVAAHDETPETCIRELRPDQFPLVLAVRISSSFPLLLSAVPLWVIDRDMKGGAIFRKCWFSDGGICSNFPIHLFDAMLPRWPTFGLKLEDVMPGHGAERVTLPRTYDEGYGETWNMLGQDPKKPYPLLEFMFSILNTMQNWNDNTLAHAPGVRDRVVRIGLEEGEGGLNLNMEKELIDTIAKLGGDSADALLTRFGGADGPPTQGWDEQRAIRLAVLVKLLEVKFPELGRALASPGDYATGYAALVENGERTPLPGTGRTLTMDEVRAIKAVLDGLAALAPTVSSGGSSLPFEAIPVSELRVRPQL